MASYKKIQTNLTKKVFLFIFMFVFRQPKVRDLRQNVREVQDNETYKLTATTPTITTISLRRQIRNH